MNMVSQITLNSIFNRVATVGFLHQVFTDKEAWQPENRFVINSGEGDILEGSCTTLVVLVMKAGLVDSRALLEFLGIANDGTQPRRVRIKAIQTRRSDDIGIEDLPGLSPITLAEAAVPFANEEEMHHSFSEVFHFVNKAGVHLTSALGRRQESPALFEKSTASLLFLLRTHVYEPLGIEFPFE